MCEALARLEEFRVPSAPVISPYDAPKYEYFEKRGTLRTVKDPILGDFVIPGFPLRFSEQPEFPELTAPLLGEHNQRVLGELLGYSADKIAALVTNGVLIKGNR